MNIEELRADTTTALKTWADKNGLEHTPEVVFSTPPPQVEADISIPWPLATGKKNKRNPLELAEEALSALKGIPDYAKATASKPGFINVSLSEKTLTDHLLKILESPQDNGRPPSVTPRRILLEFVSANPTGPVHIASGRAASLGDSLARIFRRRGHKVATENYVNDAGRQVELLGQSVHARYVQAKGGSSEIPEGGYQGEYIKDIAAAAPPEASNWTPEDFARFAVKRMRITHKNDMSEFRVEFDRWFLESELHASNALDVALKKLKKLGRIKEKDGAVWLAISEEDSEDDKDRVLIRADGRPTYFMADIAYHQDKLDRGHTELIDILGADHHGYVPRMKDAITALGYPKGTFQALIHQLVRLYRGKEVVKMSKRSGEFVTLRELVRDVGVDACRFFFARHTPNAHMNFDIELAQKRSSENPVFYVQYVHARIRSLFREAPGKGLTTDLAKSSELTQLTHKNERALLLKLWWFPETLRVCERDLSPHALPTYLSELSTLYHAFYENCRVLDATKKELSRARLTLCEGVRTVIADGLDLLGVSAPEEM